MDGETMDRRNEVPVHQRFRVIAGGGAKEKTEADLLDQFLAGSFAAPGKAIPSDPIPEVESEPPAGETLDSDPVLEDPVLISSLRDEERGRRRRKIGRALAAVLILGCAVALPFLWFTGALSSGGQVSSKTERAQLLIEQGRALRSEERHEEALANFDLAVKLAPQLPDAWAELGLCHMQNYQSELAEKAFQKAISLEPKARSHAYQSLGNLYLRRGEQRKAEAIWQEGKVDRQLARLYLLQGRFQEAEARLAPLLHESPDDDLLSRMALAARTRRLDPDLRSFLEPEPSGLTQWADLGWRLASAKRHEEATRAFSKALAEIPYDVNALSGMGWSLLAIHRSQAAKPYFERALWLDGDHVLSLNGLAYCLKNEGKTGEAITIWEEMGRLYPGVNKGTPGLAWTYYELRDYRHAALYFARLVKRYPNDSRLIDALNVAVENIGPVHYD